MQIQKARDQAFTRFMSEKSTTASCLAHYSDYQLKKGLKGADNNETDKQLNLIISLFRYIQNRDVFIFAYTEFLANRLLEKTSLSSEAEESFLSKMKVECGVATVSKISKMFADISESKELNKLFK